MKRIKLEKMDTVMGRPFRTALRDAEGNNIMDVRRDGEGNPIKQVPRDEKGIAVPNCMPETVYQARTREMKNEALCELLKLLYLNMEVGGYKLLRIDTISGTKMMQSIDKVMVYKDGLYYLKPSTTHLELEEDVHDWVKQKLQNEKVGVEVFKVNLAIIEDAVDNFEKPHEPKDRAARRREEKEGETGDGPEEGSPTEE